MRAHRWRLRQETTAFQMHIATQGRMDCHLRAANYRFGHLSCRSRSGPGERSIFQTELARGWLLAAQTSAAADAAAVARHSPANKLMVGRFTPATTIVACAPPAAFSSKNAARSGASVPT